MVELLFLWLTYEKYLYDYSKYMSGFYVVFCMMKNILKGGNSPTKKLKFPSSCKFQSKLGQSIKL